MLAISRGAENLRAPDIVHSRRDIGKCAELAAAPAAGGIADSAGISRWQFAAGNQVGALMYRAASFSRGKLVRPMIGVQARTCAVLRFGYSGRGVAEVSALNGWGA